MNTHIPPPRGRGLLSIAFDDVDSGHGGCTTHFTGLLLMKLAERGVELADYPLLVRLNPGIPWKTRGNAATVLRVWVSSDSESRDIAEEAWSLALEYTEGRELHAGKSPGMVVLEGWPWSPRLLWLYKRGVTGVLARDVVERIVSKAGGVLVGGRGVLGAAAALASLPPKGDYTWELIAYRRPELWGEPRCTSFDSAVRAEARMPPCTYNNLDFEARAVAASPRGPDPVLAGFRGDCREYLGLYGEALCEKPHFWVLFRSNQHTDPHDNVEGEIYPYTYLASNALVVDRPEVLPGGHTVVRASVGGVRVDLTFYREAQPLNRVARLLGEGDLVRFHGSVRPYSPRGAPTIAVDKLEVLRVSRRVFSYAPSCPKCGSRMESAGRGSGYRCPRCGFRDRSAHRIEAPDTALLSPGVYTPREGRLRHLTMPPWRARAVWGGPSRLDPLYVSSPGSRPPPSTIPPNI